MKNITFANPEFFWLFLLIPLFAVWLWKTRFKEKAWVRFSSAKDIAFSPSWKTRLQPILLILRTMAVIGLIIALARPQSTTETTKIKSSEGIDIVLSIDVSSSMLAKDLKPNRLEALKEVATHFIKDRQSDRIGLVVYSGESYTKVPVTSDRNIVLQSLKEVTFGQVEDGTAIGMGLATAINRLKDSQAKSKVVILMTDGVNNSGFIEPKTAAELAKEYNIRVYTIGLGTNGMALGPIAYNPDGSFQYGMVQVEIDEALLKEVAKITGGKYFRATDNKKLEQIYQEIDLLEKSEIEELRYYNYQEKFRFWAILSVICLLLEFVLRNTIFRGFL